MASRDDTLVNFLALTGCDDQAFAVSFLEDNAWDLQRAVNRYIDGDRSLGAAGFLNAGGAAAAQHAGPGMGSSPPPDSAVRAPIAATRGALVDAGYSQFDAAEQLRGAAAAATAARGRGGRRGRKRGNKDGQDAFRDFTREHAAGGGTDAGADGALAELFTPPRAMMFDGTLQEMMEAGRTESRWLLVHVHDPSVFASLMINRDVWCNEAVQEVVAESFLLRQLEHQSEQGRQYCTYYHIDTFPHIGLLDPRTGRKMRSWEGAFVPPDELLAALFTFLSNNSMSSSVLAAPPPGAASSSSASHREEDAALLAAIQASLADRNAEPMLDHTLHNDSEEEEEEEEAAGDDGGDYEQGLGMDHGDDDMEAMMFAGGDDDHEEEPQEEEEEEEEGGGALPPPDAEPAAGPDVTRIQLRLPDGRRVVRRFGKGAAVEQVRRAVAELLGGVGAGAFAVRTGAPPVRTIDVWDETVEAADLCNASVIVVAQ